MINLFRRYRIPPAQTIRERAERACTLEARQLAARHALGDRQLVPPHGKPSSIRYRR